MRDHRDLREYADGQIVPGTPYRVVGVVGAGGMGCVYEVEHVELGRRYVLKSMLRALAEREDLIARMRTEWRALGRLSHANIVDVVNAGIAGTGTPYYVMERLDGESLAARLRRRGPLGVAEAARIAQLMLRGLGAAHRIGVVHRDVKPANVFLTRDGGVKVLDFGIAKVLDDPSAKTTARGTAIGTPRYMSPEQASGSPSEPRSDVYAVGLVLFEMLAGRGPFDDARDHATQMVAHLTRPAPAVADAAPGVPAALSVIVARALAKKPTDRAATADAMADSLEPFARGCDLASAFEPARAHAGHDPYGDETRVDLDPLRHDADARGTPTVARALPIPVDARATGSFDRDAEATTRPAADSTPFAVTERVETDPADRSTHTAAHAPKLPPLHETPPPVQSAPRDLSGDVPALDATARRSWGLAALAAALVAVGAFVVLGRASPDEAAATMRQAAVPSAPVASASIMSGAPAGEAIAAPSTVSAPSATPSAMPARSTGQPPTTAAGSLRPAASAAPVTRSAKPARGPTTPARPASSPSHARTDDVGALPASGL